MPKMCYLSEKRRILFLAITFAFTLVYMIYTYSTFEHQESELDKKMSKMLSKLATRDFSRGECKNIKRIGGNKRFLHLTKNQDNLYM